MDLTAFPRSTFDASRGPAQSQRTCSCGSTWQTTWYRDERLPSGGAWAYPRIDPCAQCEPREDFQAERELQGRMRRADVPDPFVHFDFERVTTQRIGEDFPLFQERAKRDKQLGASHANLAALRHIRDWHPPTWLLIHGPPGTGKTTVLAALARRLLTLSAQRFVDLHDEHPHFARLDDATQAFIAARGVVRFAMPRVSRTVLYARVDDVLNEERVRIRGFSDHPVRDVARGPSVLLLDELGLADRPPQREVDVVERILGERYDRRLTTVLATNRTPGELCSESKSLYGRRVADRLRAAAHVELGGPSWR